MEAGYCEFCGWAGRCVVCGYDQGPAPVPKRPAARPRSPGDPWPTEIEFGSPHRRGLVSLFPLYAPESGPPVPLGRAWMGAGFVHVHETAGSGSVPQLLIENRGDLSVLFLEGEILRGGRQHRALNTSLLVPGYSTLVAPVSCVERGRWSEVGHEHVHSGADCPSTLTHTLRSSVTQSLRRGRGHASDQGKVWNEVQAVLDTARVSSTTTSLLAAYAPQARREPSWTPPYVYACSGFAAAYGPDILSVDLFDSPATCQAVWNSRIAGLLLGCLSRRTRPGMAGLEDVTRVLNDSRSAEWSLFRAAGEGEEHRSAFGGVAGACLTCRGRLIHGSLTCGLS